MDKGGIWLLVDAAGPASVMGLVKDGDWLGMNRCEGDFLEWQEPAISRLLSLSSLRLEDLSGAIYARGPGSTLGLRLAAMLIRALMEVPSLKHWQCHQYHNLELALAAHAGESWQEAVAPWKRDCLHHCQRMEEDPLAFRNGSLRLAETAELPRIGFILGRRPANHFPEIDWRAYPVESIAPTLKTFPELLSKTDKPAPYTAGQTEFAKWSPRRHSAQ